MIKEVVLGDDPWSMTFKNSIMTWPHYQTAIMWKHDLSIPVEDTPYYRGLMLTLDYYGSVWNGIIKSKTGVLAQCHKFKEMFLTAPNWQTPNLHTRGQHFYGPISVKILDEGEIDVFDGFHRLSILLALDLPLRVCICSRSKEWENIIEGIKSLNEKTLYQKILHPDFYDWPAYDRSDKVKAIRSFMPGIYSVLDLGTCYGYLLHELRHNISSATAVESNPPRYAIAKPMLQLLRFETYNRDMLEHLLVDNKQYDIVWALAVFHHFSRANPFEKFELLIQKIKEKAPRLIYELPSPGEEQFSWMYENMDQYLKSQFSEFTTVKIPNREIVCGTF